MANPKSVDIRTLSLDDQIDTRRSDIRTDKLDMTYGEFTNMYGADELVVAPTFQRLFRWAPAQKTRFLESILLGIPTPAIFVAETEDGVWELIDGLQRLSTVLEFFGVLKNAEGQAVEPSRLVGEEGAVLPGLDGKAFEDLSLRSRLSIRRAGCRVEVVKVGSGRRMKYDIFERLNTGGAHLTEQEIRNCIFRAESPALMDFFDGLAQVEPFRSHLGISDRQEKSLYDRGLVLRFFALKNDIGNFRHDVDPFVTEYIHKIADQEVEFDQDAEAETFKRTIKAITGVLGDESWKNWRGDKAQGAFSVYVFEALSLAVAKHIDAVDALGEEECRSRFNALKQDEEFKSAAGSGGNTKPRLLQRLAAAERIVAQLVDDEAENDGNDEDADS